MTLETVEASGRALFPKMIWALSTIESLLQCEFSPSLIVFTVLLAKGAEMRVGLDLKRGLHKMFYA